MSVLSFKPNSVTNNLISGLKDRTKDILAQRFGFVNPERKTLDAIGQKYNITRERVRQIINFVLNSIKQGTAIKSAQPAFSELKDVIDKKGWVLSEKELLDHLADEPILKNHILFLLVLGDDFTRFKEDDDFHHRWTVDEEGADGVHQALKQLHQEIEEEKVLSEKEIISLLREKTEDTVKKEITDEILRSWLNISKIITSNSLGEWGSVSSSLIRPRGLRDLVFLVLKKHGSPMHFSEAAQKVSQNFSCPAHIATVHNELIKDDRFVLVGRGIYALAEWGYKPGTVREVIKGIIKTNGSLTKEEIVKMVLKERYIKENTILVGLQNRQYFRRNKDGKYITISN
ncbi:MAG: hypothetical protein NTX55_00365 [Candidatus Parcubacteria bacterium]|nr:hypothetical protein [Candidatus Parcubacteria bacterium]